MKLYGYWRSSAAYRVRIVLHLKGIPFESIPVHLVKNGGEQHSEDYTSLNATHLVPTLVDGDVVLNQSIAIIDYLDSVYPQANIYPKTAVDKAQVQAMALDIACEVHPLNNLRVQQYLANELSVGDAEKLAWTHHWMKLGFAALEEKCAKYAGKYCYGDEVSMADICLVPQVYNANRFGLDMSEYPNIVRIVENCNQLEAFKLALPENQPDAQ
ncbi:maleylacetoacetate isomerase [Thalassotalea fusca]